MTIARDGFPFIAGGLGMGALLAAMYVASGFWPILVFGLIFIVFGCFCLVFFRNPRRTIPDDEAILVSPADGRILRVQPVEDPFVGRGTRVDIFLSIFDVHLNRIPASGKIAFVEYRPGRFFSAFKDKASEDNERTDVGISGAGGNLRVAQIAGSIARRIVCRVHQHDDVRRGQIFGLIRFGSRAEITFPRTYAAEVVVGQRLKGGVTIIGRWTGHG